MKTLLEIKKFCTTTSTTLEDVFSQLQNKLISMGYEEKLNHIDLKAFCFEVIDIDMSNFEIEFIKKWIIYLLDIPKNNLWNDIFDIKLKETEISYHGSGTDNIMVEVNFILKTKDEQLNNIPGSWIFNNNDKVQQFMSNDNLIYSKLEEIKTIFPLSGVELK